MTTTPLDPIAPRPRAESLSCASCGAAIASRGHGWSVTIVCSSCGAVLDALDPNLQVLQKQEAAIRVKPRLDLGTRGTWKGAPWELIGFQVVTITVDGTDYSWTEYVAFNPYRGFLYLSEYQGHWNVIEKLRRRPHETSSNGHATAELDGRSFKHFQTAIARTTFALGEFPWELRVGDTIAARDFVAPPYILSAEASEGETTWSLGTYTSPEMIAKAFAPSAKLISPVGVFANQPNPYEKTSGAMARRLMLFLTILIVMAVGNALMSRGEVAFTNRYSFTHGTDDSAAFVTPAFVLDGRPSSVTIDVETDLENDWVFFTFSLINETTGSAFELSEQVSYYSGRDSDGNWSEGSRRGSVRVGSVPGGRYFLRVAPEGGEPLRPPVQYTLRVKRDTPSYAFYVIAFAAILLPGLFGFLPGSAFESRRWAESDYAGGTYSGDEEDE